ncbi:hypothetical protein RFI_05668 [Reticulomyxa filosa]|uniref:Uncharacterized protein n=1 Tax=Reticulomyxa filosa TaxID=46433 RepID=X6P054_RETFI|nr:hypothetical protein RFI_05668 [Reticulomyxa filosa]|eukprot:ETO31454.1 hypothetical protein RFI_05668 [Reticulomyxa filosa]
MTTEVEFKIIMLGVGGVGKCFQNHIEAEKGKFVKNEYSADYDPTIEDQFKKKHHIPELSTAATLIILDTAGQAELANSQDYSKYVSADAFVIVFSVVSSQSLLEGEEILLKLVKEFGFKEILCQKKTLVLCANKCDIPESNHQVKSRDIKSLAEKYDTKLIYQASAKNNIAIQGMFDDICRDILKKRAFAASESTSTTTTATSTARANNGKCSCVIL